MRSVINNFTKSKPEEAEWFAKKTLQIIYDVLKIKIDFITNVKTFYNEELRSCVIKLRFDEKHIIDLENDSLYFLLDFNSKEMERWGRNFEQAISCNDSSVTWIKNNKVNLFNSDNEIMHSLSKKLQ